MSARRAHDVDALRGRSISIMLGKAILNCFLVSLEADLCVTSAALLYVALEMLSLKHSLSGSVFSLDLTSCLHLFVRGSLPRRGNAIFIAPIGTLDLGWQWAGSCRVKTYVFWKYAQPKHNTFNKRVKKLNLNITRLLED